jgi:small GTP-binding protein
VPVVFDGRGHGQPTAFDFRYPQPMLGKILDASHDDLIAAERRILGRLQVALARVDAAPDQQTALTRSIEQLDEIFLLVIVGEFNAGKSAFINALVGAEVAPEGVTPTTARITILQWGETAARSLNAQGIEVVTAPTPILEEIRIVDTPGTNAIIREHEAITAEFVPRSDIVLFVTSADRPFTETERAFLEQIRGWGKKVVLVINKIDILPGPAAVEEVRTFVADNARALLGFRPEVFPVSAKLARLARETEPETRAASGFGPLEEFIAATLDAPGRIRLKLLNPLGVATSVADRHLTLVRDRLALLGEDLSTIGTVEDQLALYQQDLDRGFDLRMAEIDRVLVDLESRGRDYFDNTLRIGRVFDLINRSRIQQEFEQLVIARAPEQIEERVTDLVDWLVAADLRQWQAVNEHLADRRRRYHDRIVGDESSRFHYDRTRLIDAVGREAQRVVDSYDRRREAQEIADNARAAVATAAAAGATAVGLGTLVTMAATTAAADVTGLALASVAAAVSFFVLPARRRKARDQMRARIARLRQDLSTALRRQFSIEIQRSGERIRDGIAPYSRFVRAEEQKLREVESELSGINADIATLRARIEVPPEA